MGLAVIHSAKDMVDYREIAYCDLWYLYNSMQPLAKPQANKATGYALLQGKHDHTRTHTRAQACWRTHTRTRPARIHW